MKKIYLCEFVLKILNFNEINIKKEKIEIKKGLLMKSFLSEPAGTRTQGPYIKSVLLYQLSYEFNPLR